MIKKVLPGTDGDGTDHHSARWRHAAHGGGVNAAD